MMKGKPTCWKVVTQLFVWRRNTVQYDFQKHKCTAGKRTSCLFAAFLNLFYSCREGAKMHFISTTVPTETFCISKKARATYRVLAGSECWPPWSLALRNIPFFFLLLPELILLNMWKGQNRKSFYCTYWSKFHTTTEEKTKLDINAKLKTLTERVMTACIDTSFMLPQREKNFNVIELPNFWFERGTSTKLLASSSVVRNKLFLLILATYFLNLHQTNSSKMKL